MFARSTCERSAAMMSMHSLRHMIALSREMNFDSFSWLRSLKLNSKLSLVETSLEIRCSRRSQFS